MPGSITLYLRSQPFQGAGLSDLFILGRGGNRAHEWLLITPLIGRMPSDANRGEETGRCDTAQAHSFGSHRFPTRLCDLVDRVKEFGFDLIEICIEGIPGTRLIRPAIRARAERVEHIDVTVCGAFGSDHRPEL